MRPSIDYSDDEDEYNGSDSDPECDDPAMKAINSMLSKDSSSTFVRPWDGAHVCHNAKHFVFFNCALCRIILETTKSG